MSGVPKMGSASASGAAVKVRGWLNEKVVTPVQCAICQGLDSNGVASGLALGLTTGVFPIPGLTTVPTLVFAFVFQINVVVAQATNLLGTPLNLATVVPYMWLGQWILGADEFSFSIEEFSLSEASKFALPISYGVVAWLVTSPILYLLAYTLFKPASRFLVNRAQHVHL